MGKFVGRHVRVGLWLDVGGHVGGVLVGGTKWGNMQWLGLILGPILGTYFGRVCGGCMDRGVIWQRI